MGAGAELLSVSGNREVVARKADPPARSRSATRPPPSVSVFAQPAGPMMGFGAGRARVDLVSDQYEAPGGPFKRGPHRGGVRPFNRWSGAASGTLLGRSTGPRRSSMCVEATKHLYNGRRGKTHRRLRRETEPDGRCERYLPVPAVDKQPYDQPIPVPDLYPRLGRALTGHIVSAGRACTKMHPCIQLCV